MHSRSALVVIHDWREEPVERRDDRSPPTGQIGGEEMHETVASLKGNNWDAVYSL